ncbi:Uncharacterised protein [uncultured archaeon]|nr:Uncharacterised protein [uncultured archaeon]
MAANLKRRLTPSYAFTFEVETDAGLERLALRLCFDFNALSLVEEKTGFSLLTGAIFNHLTAGITLTMFWAAVIAYQPEYAVAGGREVLGSMITHRNAGPVADAVEECFVQSLPPDQQERIRLAKEEAKAKLEAKRKALEAGQPVEDSSNPPTVTPATA